jgi:hypothetical protein
MANVTQAAIIPDLRARAQPGPMRAADKAKTQKNGQSVDCPFFLKMASAVDVLDR